MNKGKLFVVNNCKQCPNMEKKRTPCAGFAEDWFCKSANQKIAGYIEWRSEEPKDFEFPKFCPLVSEI